jgi:hypothetical protein
MQSAPFLQQLKRPLAREITAANESRPTKNPHRPCLQLPGQADADLLFSAEGALTA